MILKVPSTTGGNGHSDNFYDDNDDFDANEIDSSFEDDFSEYLWMENEEEFDTEEMKRLEEEALMEQCIEAMLEDSSLIEEEIEREIESQGLCHVLATLQLQISNTESSKLNPNAKEFVPSLAPTSSSTQC